MLDRRLLKDNAKSALPRYFLWAFIVCLIVTVLTGNGEYGIARWNLWDSVNDLWDYITNVSFSFSGLFGFLFGSIFSFLGFLFTLITTIIAIVIGNVVAVGAHRFFIESRNTGQSAGLLTLLSGFTDGNYVNIVITMFLRKLYTFLWSLLFVVPGIVKHYEYSMIPYLLAENPTMDYNTAFRVSRQMMDGQKWEAFVLDISFWLWYAAGSLLFWGIGTLFVNPYYEATWTEYYIMLKETRHINY